MRRHDLLHWIPRIVIVIIVGQTLPFKFMAAPESVWIFEQLNMEPTGRLGIATIELLAVLALLSKYYILGAIISLSIISAANFYHFTRLGLIINNDGGALFIMSIIVLACALWLLIYWNGLRRRQKATFTRPDEYDADEVFVGDESPTD